MRKLALVVVLFALSGCTFLKDTGASVCTAETQVSEMVDKAGSWAGLAGAGPLIADVLTAGLGLFCGIADAGLSAPNAVGDAIGVTSPASSRPVPDEVEDPGSL